MAVPRPIARLISAAQISLPTFVAGAAASSDATQLALNPALACILVGTGVLTSAIVAVGGRRHEKDSTQTKELVDALCRQRGGWKRGLEDLLIANGVDLKKLPEAARSNPLAQFYLLMTAPQEEVAHFLQQNTSAQIEILRAIENSSEAILSQVADGAELLWEAKGELYMIQYKLDEQCHALARIEAKHEEHSTVLANLKMGLEGAHMRDALLGELDATLPVTEALPDDIQALLDRGQVLKDECKYSQAAALYESALDLASDVQNIPALVKIRIDLAEVLIHQSSYSRAKHVLEACLVDLRTNPAPKSRGQVLRFLGHIAVAGGRVQDGKAYCLEALTTAQSLGDRFDEGLALIGLALTDELSGNLPEAHRVLDEAAIAFRIECRESEEKHKAKALINLAGALSMKATVYSHEGRADEMLTCLAEAERLMRASKHVDNLARVLVSKSKALFAKARWDEGLRSLEEARDIFLGIGNFHWLLQCYNMRARLAFQMNDQNTALAVCLGAITVAAEKGSQEDHVNALGQMAALCRRNGLHEPATALNADAKRLAKDHNLAELLVDLTLDEANNRRGTTTKREDDEQGKQMVHEALKGLESLLVACEIKGRRAHYMSRIGELHARLRNLIEARSWFERALRNFEEIGDAGGIADCLGFLAATAREEGDVAKAIQLMEELLDRSKSKPLHYFQAGAHHDLVQLKLSHGDTEGARKHFDASKAICACYPMPDVEEALRETEKRLEVIERSRKPTTSDLPMMLREVHAWKNRYPQAAQAILSFWYYCFSAELWSNCRSRFGIKFLVRAGSVHEFERFVAEWEPLGDLFVYGTSLSLRSERGIDVFPWFDEMLVPRHVPCVGFKGKAPEGEAGAKALIGVLKDVPYFMTFFSGTVEPFPDANAFIVGRRYRVPDEIHNFMFGHSIEDLVSKRMIIMPVQEREDDAPLTHDMCVAWENRLLPVFFGTLPSDNGISVERTLQVSLPLGVSQSERSGSPMRNERGLLRRFMAEVGESFDIALTNLHDGMKANAGVHHRSPKSPSLHILRFKAGPSDVHHPALVVPV